MVTPGVSYLVMATCQGYLNHMEELTIAATDESHEDVLQFPLAPISMPVLIDNIFYEFDRAELTKDSEKALDELVTLLNQNPHVTIELSAHCDYKGSAEYNKRLSQRRAESVVNYLMDHGIEADRLTPVATERTDRRRSGQNWPRNIHGSRRVTSTPRTSSRA